MAALGLSDLSTPDANRVGMIWVTADQRPSGPRMARMLCIEFGDGSGMTTSAVAAAWRPPGSGAGQDVASPAAWQLLLVGLAALLLVLTSLLAFRGRR